MPLFKAHMKKIHSPLMNINRLLALALLSANLSACVSAVVSTPARLEPLAAGMAAPELQLRTAADIRLATGYSRELSSTDRWHAVGRLPQGLVYRLVGSVFTVEGRDVHEAYLVIDRSALVGFYLPGEARYSALENPISLLLTH